MPKRKREDDSVEAVFFRFRTDLFHALKVAKGFERQRQSKRLRDANSTPDKKARIENEVVVLKSLDLHQTAHAHLCSALLRIKAVAESDKLPNEIKAGVPKPELTEEEKAALHNVTSALYNRKPVKEVVEKAVEAVCRALHVPVPEKKGKIRGRGREEGERGVKDDKEENDRTAQREGGKKNEKDNDRAERVSEIDKPRRLEKKEKQRAKDEVEQVPDEDSMDEEEEEKVVSQMDKFLGLDSDEEDDEEEEELVKGGARKPRSKVELDPMEITTDEESADEDGEDYGDVDALEATSDEEGDDSGSEEFRGFSDSDDHDQHESTSDEEDDSDAEGSSSSRSRSPPAKKPATSSKAAKPTKATDSMFLPTLMGGYISGSESASDVDIAPPRKNRRGQRARQAIWEKKYGEKAKHLQKAATGRDAGWDPKRGAVDGDAKPWKRGIRNPLLEKKGPAASEASRAPPKREPPERKRDDSGPLHPSWEAKRQAKAKEQLTAPFQGKKITFD